MAGVKTITFGPRSGVEGAGSANAPWVDPSRLNVATPTATATPIGRRRDRFTAMGGSDRGAPLSCFLAQRRPRHPARKHSRRLNWRHRPPGIGNLATLKQPLQRRSSRFIATAYRPEAPRTRCSVFERRCRRTTLGRGSHRGNLCRSRPAGNRATPCLYATDQEVVLRSVT